MLGAYPTYLYLSNNGYCYTNSPPVKNATYCYTFISPGWSTITLDAGISYVYFAGFTLSFSNFKLYTSAPSCTYIGAGLTFSGLTTGASYTWCFDTSWTGGGAGSGVNAVCPYFIYTAPLPIELADFYCIYSNDQMQLNWSTYSELNCDQFEIMRSTNGIDFETIGIINGNGTSSNTHYYLFNDNYPFELNYYKLKQVDNNGDYTYSNIISGGINEIIQQINYYNLLGERIDIEDVVNGIYVKEIVTSNNKHRNLYYKS